MFLLNVGNTVIRSIFKSGNHPSIYLLFRLPGHCLGVHNIMSRSPGYSRRPALSTCLTIVNSAWNILAYYLMKTFFVSLMSQLIPWVGLKQMHCARSQETCNSPESLGFIVMTYNSCSYLLFLHLMHSSLI